MEKTFLKSKTIWGIFITFLGSMLPALGLDFGPELVGEIQVAGDNAISATQALVEAFGIFLAIWGRLTATTTLKP
jgi:hypothetical protein